MADKPINKKLLVKSSFWYTVSMFLTRGIGFITTPIFTRLMPKEVYGDYSVFVTWQSILLIICSIEVHVTLNRARFDYTEKKDLDSYIISSLVLTTALTGVVFLLYMFFPHLFERLFLLDRKYMYVMFAYLFAVPALNMFQTKQRIEYRYKVSSTISITIALLSPLLGVLFVMWMKDNQMLGRALGQYMLYILFGILFYGYYIVRSRKISARHWKYALRIGIPLVFTQLSSRILLSSDHIILKHMCSAEVVSNVSITHSTSHLITILVQTLNLAWAPWFYDMLKIRNHSEIRKVFRIYLWAMIFCTFAVLLVGPEVIALLGSSKYRESIYILPACSLCGVFSVLIAQFGNLETYHKKPEYAAALTGIVAILNVVLDIVGVKLWGYQAVCYVTVFCQVLLIVLHYIVTRKMNIRELLPVKTLLLAMLVTLLLIPFSLLLYRNQLVRYSFVAIIFVAAIALMIVFREKILHLIRLFKKSKST